MKTTRSRVILATCLLAAVVGCKKDKKEEGTGAAGTGGKPAPMSAAVESALAMIPMQSDGVIGIDVAALRSSALYKAYEPQLRGAGAGPLEDIQKLCGFDPMTKVQRIVVGGAGEGQSADATAVVDGLAKGEVMACLEKAAASPPPDFKITLDGELATIEEVRAPASSGDPAAPAPPPPPPGSSLSLQFADDDTVVVVRRGGKAVDKATMQSILAAKPGAGITGSQPFMEMLKQVDTGATAWFVVNGKSGSVQRLGRGFLSFDAAFGDVVVASGLEIDATLRVESEDAAQKLASTADQQVKSMRKSLMKDMIGEVAVKQSGRDVRFHVVESKEQLDKLVDFAGTMLGGILGE